MYGPFDTFVLEGKLALGCCVCNIGAIVVLPLNSKVAQNHGDFGNTFQMMWKPVRPMVQGDVGQLLGSGMPAGGPAFALIIPRDWTSVALVIYQEGLISNAVGGKSSGVGFWPGSRPEGGGIPAVPGAPFKLRLL